MTQEQRKRLRELAEQKVAENYTDAYFNPQTILSLLDRVDRLERALKFIASGDIAPSSIDCYIDEYYSKIARKALEEK